MPDECAQIPFAGGRARGHVTEGPEPAPAGVANGERLIGVRFDARRAQRRVGKIPVNSVRRQHLSDPAPRPAATDHRAGPTLGVGAVVDEAARDEIGDG